MSRRAIAAFFVVLAGSAVVSCKYLLPPILAMLRTAEGHAMGLILLVSVISSLFDLGTMLTCLFVGHGFIMRRHSDGRGVIEGHRKVSRCSGLTPMIPDPGVVADSLLWIASP